jgi:dTDP-4-amino-4,6-dideoxygalactose transaminase
MLTLFKQKGYRMEDYPNTYRLYANEISLPIYNGLTTQQVDYVIEAVVEGVKGLFEIV